MKVNTVGYSFSHPISAPNETIPISTVESFFVRVKPPPESPFKLSEMKIKNGI